MGRAAGNVYMGRAAPTLSMGTWSSPAPTLYNGYWSGQRMHGMCAPVLECCCAGPVNVAPGAVRPVIMNWGRWIESLPEYSLEEVVSASLIDMRLAPPAPADPDIIKVVTGKENDGTTPDNEDAHGFIDVLPPYGTLALIEASRDAQIGHQYKLDICVTARNCRGRVLRECGCVVITIAEC